MIVKALSLWNPPFLPWATLCVTGDKKNETRPRRMLYRGPLLIHATAKHGVTPDELERFGHILRDEAIHTIVRVKRLSLETWGTYEPQGVILGVVDVTGCEEVSLVYERPDEPERSFGNYAYGRFVIALANPRMLAGAHSGDGKQGLWNFDTAGHTELEALLKGV